MAEQHDVRFLEPVPHNLDDFITQDELRALSDNYKRIAGFAVADVKQG